MEGIRRKKRGGPVLSGLFLINFILLLSPLLYTPGSLAADKGRIPQLFLEANQAYEKDDYRTSSELYEEVLDSGIHSGMIYYNLGNCYVKMGQTGKALLNYRKAERLIPRNGDLKFNLQYVLEQRRDKIETKNKIPFARAFFFWYYWLSLKELLFIFIAVNLLFWFLSLFLLYKRNDTVKWIRAIAFCLFLIFGISLGIKVYAQKLIHQGVVITSEATVRSGNGHNHSALFILHEGSEFRVEERTTGWTKIGLADGKIGWISSDAIEII
ncbi:MAG: tetratricopeptide repeat protein [bacterium]